MADARRPSPFARPATPAPRAPFARRAAVAVLAACALGAGAATASAGEISLENLDEYGRDDGAIYDDRLIFNDLENTNSGVVPKTTATVRIHNGPGTPLQVSDLQVSGNYVVDPPVALPAVVPANGSLDVQVRFDSVQGQQFQNGALTIVSDATNDTSVDVELRGHWQQNIDDEPTLQDMMDVLGYQVDIGGPLARHGLIQAVGDEVLSPYWRRADPGQPVVLRQLAAFHGEGTSSTARHAKDAILGGDGLPLQSERKKIMAHDPTEWQTLLPHEENPDPQFRGGVRTFNPGDGLFGFKVSDAWSDDTFNPPDHRQDDQCELVDPPEPCGHAIRFYPAKDRGGTTIPNAYIMAMDFPNKNYDYNDNVFFLSNVEPEDGPPPDNEKPVVVSKSPDDGDSGVPLDQDIEIEFSEPILTSSVKTTPISAGSVRFFEGGTGGTRLPIEAEVNGSTVVLDPEEALEGEQTYTVQLRSGIEDYAGNSLSQVTWSFTAADVTPPALVSRTPAPGATGVPVGQSVQVTLSDDIDPASVSEDSARLTLGGVPVPAQRSVSGDTLTIDPIGPLASAGTFQVVLTSGLTDDGGNPLTSAPVSWTFTSQDVEGPAVTGRAPAPGAQGVPTGDSIVVDFSEAVDPASVAGSVGLTGPGGPVAVSPFLANGDRRLTIDPVPALGAGARHTVTLGAGITDVAGNPMTPTSWSFTTVAPPALPATGGGAPGGTAQAAATQDALALPATPRCATARAGSVPSIRARLNERTLIEIQRNAQDALRRVAAVEGRLKAGLRSSDLCGGGFTAAEFVPGVGLGTGAVVAQSAASPRALKIAKRPTGFRPSGRKLSARLLLINQRVAQAAVRRVNALEKRLNGGLTGSDLAPGALTPDKLAPGLVVTAKGGAAAPASNTPAPVKKSGKRGKVRLTLAQVRINERISAAALRRANRLVAKMEGGLAGGDFRNASISARELS